MCEYCKKQDDIGNIPKILSTCIPLGAIGKNTYIFGHLTTI